MLKRMSIGLTALTALSLATCTHPHHETSVASQKQANWLKVDPTGLASAKEPPPPRILPETYFAAGQLLEAQGQFAEAVSRYQRAVLLNHDYLAAHHRLGLLLGRMNRHREAVTALARAAELRPDEPVILNNLGFEYAVLEEWALAEEHLRKAVDLSPRFERARINLAMVLAKREQYEEAFEEFRAVLPEPLAWYNLGLMYVGAKRYREAGLAFHRALKLDPNLVAARTQLAAIEHMSQVDTHPDSTTERDIPVSALTGDPSNPAMEDDLPEPPDCGDGAPSSDLSSDFDSDPMIEGPEDGSEGSDPCADDSAYDPDNWVSQFMYIPTIAPQVQADPDEPTQVDCPEHITTTGDSVLSDEAPTVALTKPSVEAPAGITVEASSSIRKPLSGATTRVLTVPPPASGELIDVPMDPAFSDEAWVGQTVSSQAESSGMTVRSLDCSDLIYGWHMTAIDGSIHHVMNISRRTVVDRRSRARNLATESASPADQEQSIIAEEPTFETVPAEAQSAFARIADQACDDAELLAAADALEAWVSGRTDWKDDAAEVSNNVQSPRPSALTGTMPRQRRRDHVPRRRSTDDPTGAPWGRSAEAVDARLEDRDWLSGPDDLDDADDPCPEDVPPGAWISDRAERTARLNHPLPLP